MGLREMKLIIRKKTCFVNLEKHMGEERAIVWPFVFEQKT